MLLLVCGAAAEGGDVPFNGYFDKPVFLRPEPAASSRSLATIPAGTPLVLTPVNGYFAETVYDGKTGYVYCAEVRAMPDVVPVTPWLAYLPQNKYLFALPLDGAAPLMTVQAETPVTVTGETERFLQIEAEGMTGYVYARDAQAIGDMPMTACSAEFHADGVLQTFCYPLKNAAQASALEPGRIYLAEAVCNGYYRVTIGGDTVYVPVRSVTTIGRQGTVRRAAVITPDTLLFSAPEHAALAGTRMETEQLRLLGPQENGFQQLDEEALYICANDVTAYAVHAMDEVCLQMTADAELLLRPEAGAPQTGSVRAGRLYTAAWALEDWYLLQSEGRWGFLHRDEKLYTLLETDLTMMRTAAVLTTDTILHADDAHMPLTAGTRLTVTSSAGDFYHCETQEASGHVRKAHVRILGADTPLTAYTVTAPADIQVMDFPDGALCSVIGTIPAGGQVRVTGFNRCYLMVSWDGMTGYARQDGLLNAESRGLPAGEEAPRYELVLDKSTGMCYAFALTNSGGRDKVVICAEVGVGKRTTPTPSGTFLLGKKERWHAFTLSYTPHTTEYVRARYIHGWPCEKRKESTVKEGLAVTGTVTGGCLRSPFEFARWVYMNCTSYDTQLVIVSGGFEPPADAAAVQVK
ncbi:MAG: L,D-transpeptidase [Clostridia bacterium]|nr:L,D-transpeptidase [Clostridia bacterium]